MTLPLSAPGILAGSILVFVLTISALVTPRMLGGPTYKVMATLIYDEYMQLLDWPSGSALSFALTFMAIGVIWLSSRLTKTLGGHGMSTDGDDGRPGLGVTLAALCRGHLPAGSGGRRGAGGVLHDVLPDDSAARPDAVPGSARC